MNRISMILALLFFAPSAASAQHEQTRQGFGISFGLGLGSAGATCDYCTSERDSGISGYLRIGGYLRPNLMLAGESNGWTRSDNGVTQTLGFYSAVAQWYPNVASGLYLKGGLGLVAYTASDNTDDITAGSLGLTLGLGYDFRVGRNFSLTPYANYLHSTKGELKFNDISTGLNISANLLQVGLGFTWH